jgi:hypothetical protein
MVVLAPTILLLAAIQAGSAPFQLELPTGYHDFAAAEGTGEVWIAAHTDDDAQFELRHFMLDSPGAQSELVAANFREARWKPMLASTGHEIKPWLGPWSGEKGAGSSIEFLIGKKRRVIEQRLVVLDTHLTIATWEGGIAQRQAALDALESFVLPESWKPTPVPEVDLQRGQDASADFAPSIGHFYIQVDASDPTFQNLKFRLQLDVAKSMEIKGSEWILPVGATLLEATPSSVSYSISLYDQTVPAPKAGLQPGVNCLSGLGGTWLAFPASLAAKNGAFSPPAYTLEILAPSILEAVGATPVSHSELLNNKTTRRIVFQPRPAGQGWPIFVLGLYQHEEFVGRDVLIRRAARATRAEAVVGFMDRLQSSFSDWLPHARDQWRLVTFPGAGDFVLPGLFVFDEATGWLREPLDTPWIDGNRRAGLARKMGYQVFGQQLRGMGHGSVFLEASLSEYAAWRLLEGAGVSAEADAMLAFWRQNENVLGPLPRPLTMLPMADLLGPRRLMTRGALVWLAIEKKLGRANLDKILDGFLSKGHHWTTEDLRYALEAQSKADWMPFFQAHVYGRIQP